MSSLPSVLKKMTGEELQGIWDYNRTLMEDFIATKSGGKKVGIQELLNKLSMKELKIVREHEDLCKRVRAISQMNKEDLKKYLEEHLGYTVQVIFMNEGGDDAWLDIKSVVDRIPKFSRQSHSGVILDGSTFEDRAREILMEEVRINVYMRYIEHKKKKKSKTFTPKSENNLPYMNCGYL